MAKRPVTEMEECPLDHCNWTMRAVVLPWGKHYLELRAKLTRHLRARHPKFRYSKTMPASFLEVSRLQRLKKYTRLLWALDPRAGAAQREEAARMVRGWVDLLESEKRG